MNQMPVRVRVKTHALLCDPAQAGERKHLKAARIRQNRMRPIHETMQAAHVESSQILC